MTLFSYCIPHDDGSAPNPFWGVCTLAICKPQIRRTALVGDWIVGTGSVKFGFESQVVYAMKVTNKMTLKEYDKYCQEYLPNKIPIWKTLDRKLRKGDCIYDFSKVNPLLRPSVHKEEDKAKDLKGENVLLSDHFYYFGSKPVPLPTHLLAIVKQGQSHKSDFNEPYKEKFVEWVTTFKKFLNKVNAMPYGLKDYEENSWGDKSSKQHSDKRGVGRKSKGVC